MEEDGVRWDVVRSDLCHALGEVLHNGALTRDLHAAKDSLEGINGWLMAGWWNRVPRKPKMIGDFDS